MKWGALVEQEFINPGSFLYRLKVLGFVVFPTCMSSAMNTIMWLLVGMHRNEALECELDDALAKNRDLEKQNTALKSKVYNFASTCFTNVATFWDF